MDALKGYIRPHFTDPTRSSICVNYTTTSDSWGIIAHYDITEAGVYFVNFEFKVIGSGRVCLRNREDPFAAIQCSNTTLATTATPRFEDNDFIQVLAVKDTFGMLPFVICGTFDVDILDGKDDLLQQQFGQNIRNLDI